MKNRNKQKKTKKVVKRTKIEEEEKEKEEKEVEIEQQQFHEQDEQDEEEQDLSHLLQPITAHDLKNNAWCIDDKSGYPGQVTQLKKSKTGKHGHAKITYKLVMPFTGKSSNPMHPATDQLMRPVMTKTDYIFIKFINDDDQQVVECKNNETGKISNIIISPQPKYYEKVINSINKKKKNETVILSVLNGPKYSAKKIAIIQCVVGAKLVNDDA